MINTKGVFIPFMKFPESCTRCSYCCPLIMENAAASSMRHENCPLVKVESILNIEGDEILLLNEERTAFFSLLPVDLKTE